MTATTTPRFIALEGGDGSGKTSIRRAIFDAVVAAGCPTPLSLTGACWQDLDSTRLLTRAKYQKRPTPTDEILRAQIRERQTVNATILQLVGAERTILSDRYLYSDVAYNELHYGISSKESVDAFVEAGLRPPDVILFVDTDPELAVQHLHGRGRAIHHWETLEKQRRVHGTIRELVIDDPFGWACPVIWLRNTGALGELLDKALVALGLH